MPSTDIGIIPSKHHYLKVHFWRCVYFFIGLWIIAVGAVLTVQAQLGVPPWDVLHIGLASTLGGTMGIWSILLGLLIVICTFLFDRKLPKWGTIMNMILCGTFIDIIFYFQWIPIVHNLWTQLLLLFTGILLMGIGVGAYLASEYGAGPRDGLMIVLVSRSGKSIRFVRTIMEVLAVGLGYWLGGPVFIGTLLFSITIGPIMQITIKWNQDSLAYLVRPKHSSNPNKKTVIV